MSTGSAAKPALLSAEEFGERADPGYPEELVRGRIVPMPMPKPRHGEISCQAAYLLRRYLEDHDLGRVLSNDSGVITERGPDTVRGADIAFYSYERVPKGPLPNHYLDVPPDLIFEVRSPSDRWPKVLAKVSEYLESGVSVVIVLDDDRRSAQVFRPSGDTQVLGGLDTLTLDDLLPEFAVEVGRFFE